MQFISLYVISQKAITFELTLQVRHLVDILCSLQIREGDARAIHASQFINKTKCLTIERMCININQIYCVLILTKYIFPIYKLDL